MTLLARNFVGSIGVNTHAGFYLDGYKNSSLVVQSLKYIGVNQVRDALPGYGQAQPVVEAMATAGIKFDFVVGAPVAARGDVGLADFVSALKTFQTEHAGSVASVEGLNEVNLNSISYAGLSSLEAAAAFQRDLYDAVKHTAELVGVTVVNLSVGLDSTDAYEALGNLTDYADFGNAHAYAPASAYSTYASISYSMDLAQTIASLDGMYVTETGYSTLTSADRLGVDQQTQAELTLINLLDAYQHGAKRTFLYQLFDTASVTSPEIEKQFGLFNDDGTPKLAAVALHNLTTILANGDNPNGTVDALPDYSLTASQSGMHSLALQKSGGLTDIVIWMDRQEWNDSTDSAISNSAVTVTLTLAGAGTDIRIYDPITGLSAIKSASGNSITINLNGHPLVIELGAMPAVSAPLASTSTPTTTLTLTDAELVAQMDTLATRNDIGSINLVGDRILDVSSLETMRYMISHYGNLLSKISGGAYKFEVSFGQRDWQKSTLYNSAGTLLQTENEIFSNGVLTCRHIDYANGTADDWSYGITGETYAQRLQRFDATGKVYLIERKHADGTFDSIEKYNADGSKMFVRYDATGHKLTEVTVAVDLKETTYTYDVATGQVAKYYIDDKHGNTDYGVYASGALTYRYVHHADGTGENYAYNLTGRSYTFESQKLAADGSVLSVVRRHADGTLDYTESKNGDGSKDYTYYDASGNKTTHSHVNADASQIVESFLSSGAIRTVSYDSARAAVLSDTRNADGTHLVLAYANGLDLKGGHLNDTFYFGNSLNSTVEYAGGNDTIVGAQQSGDKIFIPTMFAQSYSDLHLEKVGVDDVLVRFDDSDSLLFRHVQISALTAEHFVFG